MGSVRWRHAAGARKKMGRNKQQDVEDTGPQSTVARGETGFWILDLAKYGKNLSVFGQSSS